MRVAITGASGLIGTALVPRLRSQGHEVMRLVRRRAAAPDEISWDPAGGTVDLEALAGVEGVVHLAGAGVGDHRWTESYKREILQSRVQGTSTISRAMAALDPMPHTLVCGSAIGYYGNRGDTLLDETSSAGTGFLADVVVAWEAAAAPAQEAGIRTTFARTGLVVAKEGGAFAKLMPIFRLGAGGKVGSGSQYWSFISLSDEVDALIHLLESDLSGPVNLTAPSPVTNAEATVALGKLLHRPALLPVPAFALKVVLGEFADDVLSSARVLPTVLEASGFTFAQPTISEALRAELV